MSAPEPHPLNAWEQFRDMATPRVPVHILGRVGDSWPVELGVVRVDNHQDHSHQVAEALRALADEIEKQEG